MLTESDFQDRFGVSRETLSNLNIYKQLLEKWNTSINLVSKSTLSDTWGRHFFDSAEAFPIIRNVRGKWLDLGTGAGLPAIILALMAKEKKLEVQTTCIETDQRKSEFLRTVGRRTNLQLSILSERIEKTASQHADAITARALAPFVVLMEYCERHLSSNGVAILHKGRDWYHEVEDAKNKWSFDLKVHPSTTDQNSVILEVKNIARV